MLSLSLLTAIVALASFTQTLTGFGFAVVVVALGVYLRPVGELVPLIVPLVTAQASWVVWTDRSDVQGRLLLARIVPLVAVGVVVGQVLFRRLAGPWMAPAFGVLVVALALTELFKGSPDRPLPRSLRGLALLLSGLMQGLFAAGGPALAYALGRSDLTKTQLRATVCALWALVNAGMTAGFLVDGRLGAAQGGDLCVLALATAVAIPLGDRAHRRISPAHFRKALYIFLCVSGAALVVPRSGCGAPEVEAPANVEAEDLRRPDATAP